MSPSQSYVSIAFHTSPSHFICLHRISCLHCNLWFSLDFYNGCHLSLAYLTTFIVSGFNLTIQQFENTDLSLQSWALVGSLWLSLLLGLLHYLKSYVYISVFVSIFSSIYPLLCLYNSSVVSICVSIILLCHSVIFLCLCYYYAISQLSTSRKEVLTKTNIILKTKKEESKLVVTNLSISSSWTLDQRTL